MQIRRAFERYRTALTIAVTLLLALAGFVALHHLLAEVRLRDVRSALHTIPRWRLLAAMGLTCLSYFLLTLYDVLALRIVGKPLPYRTAALASFTSYTLSHNLGLGLLTGGSARYRIYSAKGLTTGDIVRVIGIAGLTFWLGVSVLAAGLLALQVADFRIFGVVLSGVLQHRFGMIALAALLLILLVAPRPTRPIRLFGWTVPLPGRRQAAAQLAIAGLDLAAASAALFLLVPDLGPAVYPTFFLAYTLAIIAALISHVPGGVGVFEAVVLAAVPVTDRAELLAALIAYRCIYYLLPLAAAAILLAIHEHAQWKKPAAIILDSSRAVAASLAPMLMAALTFMGGVLLLVSGSLPAVPWRLDLLHAIVPLPFAEASHIAASLAGTGLLLLAPGLFNRQEAAFLLARTVLIAGAAFSLVKGIDYEEAAVLSVIAGLLQWTRHAFYRHSALTRQRFSPSWLVAVGAALGLSLWIGLFAYKHVSYQNQLWWEFAWHGDAPRFMRAAFATAVLLIVVAVLRLSGRGAAQDREQGDATPDRQRTLSMADRTDAMLAWTGDKRFLVSPDGGTFLMYQVQGDSWIVMGDPVGAVEEWADLLWRIREMADRAHGRVLLYQISASTLPFAIDMGLQLVKYGEGARVDLKAFTMEGPEARALRYAERRAAREGASFEVVSASAVPAIMGELRQVSDSWLQSKDLSEKAFSIGRFDAEYLSLFDCAIVRCEGRIVAFANIWATANHEELSVDLMRHIESMPYGTMDFLFVHLMQWGKQQGYRWFWLGLAPLSGINARRLAPIWARIGHLLYHHGEALYGFEGLRAYKEKFAPQWEPRYIAGPHGLGLARALVDLQTLVGGGRRSAARRAQLSLAA